MQCFFSMPVFLSSPFKGFNYSVLLFLFCFTMGLPQAQSAMSCRALFLDVQNVTLNTTQRPSLTPSNLILFKRNAFFYTAFRVIAEVVSPYLPKNFNVDQKQLEQLESSEVLLLGRFYKNPDFTLLDLRDSYFPTAQVLDGKLGFGRNLITNIQNIIRGAEKIVIWNNRIDPESFTYLYEISFIAKHPELVEKTYVTDGDGKLMRFDLWYATEFVSRSGR